MLGLSSKTKELAGMINKIVACLILLTNFTCNHQLSAQTTNAPQAKQNSSEQTAAKLIELYEKKNCQAFVNNFPNNFQAFNQLYGFDEEKGERRLYSKYVEHIAFFSDCPQPPALVKLNKVIKIGIGGRWEADAISLLQDTALRLIKDQPIETRKILNNLPDAKASSFWFFLFDGPHPGNKLTDFRAVSNLIGKKSRQARLLAKQFQKLRASEEH